jgi:hypothetical protein
MTLPAIDPRGLTAASETYFAESFKKTPSEAMSAAIAAYLSASSPPLPADVERLLSRLRERAANMNGAMKSGGLYLRLGDYADEDAALDRQAAALITALCEEIRKLKEGRE